MTSHEDAIANLTIPERHARIQQMILDGFLPLTPVEMPDGEIRYAHTTPQQKENDAKSN